MADALEGKNNTCVCTPQTSLRSIHVEMIAASAFFPRKPPPDADSLILKGVIKCHKLMKIPALLPTT